MATARVVTYECYECGSKVIVTETHETRLSPIYCCGMEVAEVYSVEEKPARRVKKAAGKATVRTAKKAVKKETAKKKKPAPKKGSSRK